MSNPISELLGPHDVLLDADCPDSEVLFAQAAPLLAARNGVPDRTIAHSLAERERLGSTGLGHGVALPHARMPNLRHAAAAVVRTRVPLAFDAPDGRPVSCFLFLLVPADAAEHHLALMASAASLFSDRRFREQLRTAPDAAAVIGLFAGANPA